MKTKTNVARVAKQVAVTGVREKIANGAVPTTTGFQPGAKKRKDAAAVGAEHTKPSNSRSVIRATEGKRWTARQQGRG